MDGTNSSEPGSHLLETMTDSELVQAYQKESREEAFDEIVRRYQSLMVNMAYHMIHDYDDALETAQDVFVKIYHALPQFQERSSFRTWLYTIARRVILNRIRHRMSRRASRHVSLNDKDMDGILETCPEWVCDEQPDQMMMSAERFGQLTAAMARLDTDHREILVLREIQEFSYEEIAAATGLNLGTVKSRIARARQHLKEILNTMGIGGKS